jgi:hypothetical protein
MFLGSIKQKESSLKDRNFSSMLYFILLTLKFGLLSSEIAPPPPVSITGAAVMNNCHHEWIKKITEDKMVPFYCIHTYIHTYTHNIPWIHKCIMKTTGCGKSHNTQNIQIFYTVKYYKNFIKQYHGSSLYIKKVMYRVKGVCI